MRVARLEVFGFKSFMDRLVLPLESGITGVVGPNGCGKSNIVDALRWVLGESRASQLRGGILEDVIFNGTDKLRPLGLAEVTITLRATERDFFSDLVSPEREAELLAEAAGIEELNASDCANNGTANNGPANNNPANQSSADQSPTTENSPISESAEQSAESSTQRPKLTVISGALSEEKVTEQAAELVIEQAPTTANPEPESQAQQKSAAGEAAHASMLSRYSWLKSVTEVQVTRRLYRSGESEYFINRVPCRLKDLKDFFRAIGIGARAYTIVAQGEMTRIISAKPQERRLILEEAAGVLGFRDRIASAGRRLEETTINISRIDDVVKEVTRQVNSLKIQASRARNRQGLKDEIKSLDAILFADSLRALRLRNEDLVKRAVEFAEKEQSALAALDKARASEEEERGEMMRVDVEGDNVRSKIDALREELSRRSEQRSKFTSRCNELRAFALARGTEIRRLEEQEKTLLQRGEEAEREVAQLEAKDRELAESLSTLSYDSADELRKIAATRDELRGKLRGKENDLQGAREKRAAFEASREALEEQIVSASPLNQLKESLGSDDLEGIRNLTSKASIFAEGLRVPAHCAKGVQSFLAERAKYIVAEEAQEIATYYSERIAGTQKKSLGLGLGVFRAGNQPAEAAITRSGLPTLLSLIEVEPHCSYAASRVFDQVYFADNLEQAFGFFRGGSPGSQATVVTSEGDIVTDHSFFSFRSENGLIHLRRRVNELKEELSRIDAIVAELSSEREFLQTEIKTAEETHARIFREAQERQAKARELSNQLGNVRGRFQAAQRLVQQVSSDKGRVKQQLVDAHNKIEEYRAEELRIIEDMKEFASENDAELHEELSAHKAAYEKIEAERKSQRNSLSELSRAVDAARRALDEIRVQVSQGSLDKQKIELEMQNVAERIRNEYGDEIYASVLDASSKQEHPLTEERKQEASGELSKLKARLIREGDVDPTSIERFEEESQRLTNLEQQRADLETASHTLQRTIARLTETSEKRFLATFAKVRENFQTLVPRFFGGGKAELELQDPAHPLESGVEIMVRPPGKKPKTIDLLSGGEKALCATALIFSMFLVRPSPLCVLDEVDAPLDEANLVRFLGMVREMSAKTQFVLITHNKSTMSVSDNLVGVSQTEPGASRIVAVSLQEAYSQVA